MSFFQWGLTLYLGGFLQINFCGRTVMKDRLQNYTQKWINFCIPIDMNIFLLWFFWSAFILNSKLFFLNNLGLEPVSKPLSYREILTNLKWYILCYTSEKMIQANRNASSLPLRRISRILQSRLEPLRCRCRWPTTWNLFASARL